MRTQYVGILALAIFFALVSVANSQENPLLKTNLRYISTIEIHVDGFVCATCVRQIENSLASEPGIARVTGDWEKGIIAVVPDQTVGWVDLFDIQNRINGTRNYTVLKMDVVAVGTVVKSPVEYYIGGVYQYSGDRYRLVIGDNRMSYFSLAQNDKLADLVDSGAKSIRATGVVSAFTRENVPILELTKYEELSGEEAAKVARSHETSPLVIPDQIVSVDLYVDGFICATCTNVLESNLRTEEGVGTVVANLETGIVTVTPVLGATIDPFYLRKRIDRLSNYTVRRMDVEAIGEVVVFPVRYYEGRNYTHTHDRYKLQVGDTFFILADNTPLHEIVKLGLKRARVKGTVLAVNNGKSILSIGTFQPVGASEKMATYNSPLYAFIAGNEKKMLEEAGTSPIESVRVYVDGFICAACETPIRNAILDDEGVKVASTDADTGLIELVPKEGQTIQLFNIEQRINAMRDYAVLKMDVVATGKIKAKEIVYGENTLYPEKSMRYVLSSGGVGDFLLSENDKLAEMLKHKDKAFAVVGTVASFWNNVPILEIREYKTLEEYPKWLR